jgi:uncharacterized heparinase superfamily protein
LHPKTKPSLRRLQGKWKQPHLLKKSITSDNPLTFSFLNCEQPIKTNEDWNSQAISKLWLYNLHYHSFLLSDISLPLKESVITKWIHENPWPVGIGWEPYPLSLRIVHWIKFSLIEPGQRTEDFTQSLFLQCFSLEKQIEYHLLGNHLFENGKALLFAGLYFDTKESKRWLKKGISILRKQLKEQILEDGGHFERSPMYHAIILEGILDIYQLLIVSNSMKDRKTQKNLEQIKKTIQYIIPKMLLWLSSLSHQDGKIAFFNDSTFEIAPESQEIYNYASYLGFSIPTEKYPYIYLDKSGYIRAENKKALVLADVGSVGPSYIPGHAHAGTLSFEVSLENERLFVNTGISTYDNNEERIYQRSTLAHNTVSIDRQSSSKTWSSFRVAERANVFDIQSSSQESHLYFSASHDGYQKSKYRLIHRREWFLLDKRLIVEDFFTGQGTPEIIASFHLHPHWSVLSQEKNRVYLQSSKSQKSVIIHFPSACEINIEPYAYAPGFNKKEKSLCFRVVKKGYFPLSLKTEIEW